MSAGCKRPADCAWIALGLAVVGYEAYAAGRAGRREVELLSEAVDRYRASHPVVVHATVWYLAGHLSRVIPRRIDPLHRLAEWIAK